eukprot:56157_1
MAAIHLIIFSILFHVYIANDVESITMLLDDDSRAPGLDGPATITLWFNFMVYQFELDTRQSAPLESFTFYKDSSPSFVILGSSNCGGTQTDADAKMMIESNHDNGIIFDQVSFNTSGGTWYGIKKVCADQSTHSKFMTGNDQICDDPQAYHWHAICVDNDPSDCGPAKQMLHFDISRHNAFISDALWTDATNVEIITCTTTTADLPTDMPTTDDPTTGIPTTNEPTTNIPTNKQTTTMPTTNIPTAITMNRSVAPVKSTSFEPYHTNPNTKNTIETDVTKADDSTDSADTMMNVLLVVIFSCVVCFCVLCIIYLVMRLKKDREPDAMVINVRSKGNASTQRMELTKTDNVLMLDDWLRNVVRLPMYCDVFVRNGYKSMHSIVKIQDVSDLENIGIKNRKHRQRIMVEIEKLQGGNTDLQTIQDLEVVEDLDLDKNVYVTAGATGVNRHECAGDILQIVQTEEEGDILAGVNRIGIGQMIQIEDETGEDEDDVIVLERLHTVGRNGINEDEFVIEDETDENEDIVTVGATTK